MGDVPLIEQSWLRTFPPALALRTWPRRTGGRMADGNRWNPAGNTGGAATLSNVTSGGESDTRPPQALAAPCSRAASTFRASVS